MSDASRLRESADAEKTRAGLAELATSDLDTAPLYRFHYRRLFGASPEEDTS